MPEGTDTLEHARDQASDESGAERKDTFAQADDIRKATESGPEPVIHAPRADELQPNVEQARATIEQVDVQPVQPSTAGPVEAQQNVPDAGAKPEPKAGFVATVLHELGKFGEMFKR